jgi:hypothetical protein
LLGILTLPEAKKSKTKSDELDVLEQIRDLLVMSLRASNVPPSTLSKITGLKEKTIRNRFPSVNSET